MLYVNRDSDASPEQPVSVRSLSHSNKTKSERAAIAARILDNRLAVCDLTVAQIAALCGTTPSTVRRHRARRKSGRHKLTLADRLLRASPTERIEAARVVGAQMIWDTMIVPVCEEDRAPAE